MKDGGRPVAYRSCAVRYGTAAERAGFEVDDLISIADVERFVRGQRPGVSYRFDVVHAGRREARTLTLGRNDWTYWRGQEGLRRLALTIGSVPTWRSPASCSSPGRETAAPAGARCCSRKSACTWCATGSPARLPPETA